MARQLGKAVSAVLAATYPDVDYCIEPELNGNIARAQLKDYDRVAQGHGFKDWNELREAVEQATSQRWVFFNLPIGWFESEEETWH